MMPVKPAASLASGTRRQEAKCGVSASNLESFVIQPFTRGEYRGTHAFLRSLRRGNQAIAAQMGPDLYEALRAIAAAVRQRRKQESDSV